MPTNPKLCFICQKKPRNGADLLCIECSKPKHVHDFKPFRFTPDAPVTYWSCDCGEQRMTAEER